MYFSFLADQPLDKQTIAAVKKNAEQFELTGQDAFWCKGLSAEIDLPTGTSYFSERNWRTEPPQLIVFDMDSTLIRAECIDEMARSYGVYDQVAETTAKAMRGELDFNESLRARLGLLAGMPVSQLEQVHDTIELQWGALSLFNELHKRGIKTAILSGGFTWFANKLAAKLGIDAVVANELEIAGDQLTGKVLGDIVNAQLKADSLVALAQRYNIDLADTVAVGDGANDLVMMKTAQLGVAIHGKPAVVEQADTAINEGGIDRLMQLLGWRV